MGESDGDLSGASDFESAAEDANDQPAADEGGGGTGSADAGGASGDGGATGDDDGDGNSPDDSDPSSCWQWSPPPSAVLPVPPPAPVDDPRCEVVEVTTPGVGTNGTLRSSQSDVPSDSELLPVTTDSNDGRTEPPPPTPKEQSDAWGSADSREPAAEACEAPGTIRLCEHEPGQQTCHPSVEGWYWGDCQCEVLCSWSDYKACDGVTCQFCFYGASFHPEWVEVSDPFWSDPCAPPTEPPEEPGTPIVLSFDGSFAMHAAEVSSPEFGLGGTLAEQGRECVVSDWPTADTPWLVIDRDADGRIDDGSELFGSGVRLASGRFARNGFEALAELDLDRSGTLDARDPDFQRLLLWRDDGDRVSQSDELHALAAMGVTSLSVTWSPSESCDERGNCAREASTFEAIGSPGLARNGVLLDLHPRCVRREDTRLDR